MRNAVDRLKQVAPLPEEPTTLEPKAAEWLEFWRTSSWTSTTNDSSLSGG